MEGFVGAHQKQLQQLNIPEPLYEDLRSQLESVFIRDGEISLNIERLASSLDVLQLPYNSGEFGSMVVIPHACSWDILDNPSSGMWKALNELSVNLLQIVLKGLQKLWKEADSCDVESLDRNDLVNRICDPRTWSRVILYRKGTTVRAALPAPPYFPQVELENEADPTEADLTGPFPFQYHVSKDQMIDTSLGYLTPGFKSEKFPTIDLVPSYTCPDPLTRTVRYVAMLGEEAPIACVQKVKEMHAKVAQQMHLVRKEKLEREEEEADAATKEKILPSIDPDRIWKVYTDGNDPMGLAHPDAGLDPSHYVMTDSLDEVDIVFSFQSCFGPGSLRDALERRAENCIFINQFPYEGAFVQKDHLAREILKQHGLPRPSWAIETYDLEVQLADFVGASLLAAERGEDVLWIAKPARGTQSKGHVVTKSTAHILRLIDAGGESRVVQRYIKNSVTIEGKKIDCRCIVLMTSADPGRPKLYMHNRVYFRIANKKHSIDAPSDLVDNERVLTATHLLDEERRSSSNPIETLPVDYKTIAKLEENYKDMGFDWNGAVLPKIHTMLRELFNEMTRAFPAMTALGETNHSRAVYGIDLMLENQSNGIEPLLTEVTFCPSNNAICDAYERDEELFRSYNTEIFDCLFRGVVSDNITELQ